MIFSLYPFQCEDVVAILRSWRLPAEDPSPRCHAALWWEPGLGKTLASIAIARETGVTVEELLILCPAHLKLTWAAEWKRWVGKGPLPSIISYNSAHLHLQKHTYKFIIADEAHYLKNKESKRAQAIVPYLQKAPYCLLLSGTPAPNGRPIELFTQGSILCADRLRAVGIRSFADYGARFCGGAGQGPEFRGCSGADALKTLREGFAGRAFSRTKHACLADLPEKQYRVIRFAASQAVRAENLALVARVDAALGVPGIGSTWLDAETPETLMQMLSSVVGLGAYANLSRLFAEAKAELAAAYVVDCLRDGEQRLVVFGEHRGLLQAIGDACHAAGAHVGWLWGGVSPACREQNVRNFQSENPIPHVLCCNYSAAGTGLTLTAAQHVILAEQPWTPGVCDQAVDRLHRIGQKGSVLVDSLCVAGTLDEWRAELVDGKRRKLKSLYGDKDSNTAADADSRLKGM